MSFPGHHITPNPEDHGSGPWPIDSKRPIYAAPVPQPFVSIAAPSSHLGFIVLGAQQHTAGHFGISQYAPYIITPLVTPPNLRVVYNARGRSRVPPQAHHQHLLYINPNYTNPTYLPSVLVIVNTTAIGATELTVATGATGATKNIIGPNRTLLIPPPNLTHPSYELSQPIAKAMENFSIPHCYNYLQTKDLLRDEINKKEQY
ncbi:hypothetical protein B0H65DRAFT_512515 [Neurospora tetraspora]|uniref:Uncharacterized protein n=1 Tax=Neurospora tetraspora TaxID=94610 RepID=A0AAE0J0U0_9PEZI|nr:hypothetical protein B0H65DRAFT_512515 [Neurospora tetraspora]